MKGTRRLNKRTQGQAGKVGRPPLDCKHGAVRAVERVAFQGKDGGREGERFWVRNSSLAGWNSARASSPAAYTWPPERVGAPLRGTQVSARNGALFVREGSVRQVTPAGSRSGAAVGSYGPTPAAGSPGSSP